MDGQSVWGSLFAHRIVSEDTPHPGLKRSLRGRRPSAGAHRGSCNPAAPLSGVCFDRGSFMPKTMPALFSLLPAGSGGREGGQHCHTASNSHNPVTTTMRLQVPQIMSCPLGTGEGDRAREPARADLGHQVVGGP